MTGLAQDLRFALRGLRRQPGFTAVAVLTLALALGANSAIFSVVSGVLLRPLPYPQPDRLMMVMHTQKGWPVAPATFMEWRDQSRAFAGLAAAQAWAGTLRPGAAGPASILPTDVRGLQVSSNLFDDVLGVPIGWGRPFLPADQQTGAARTVILSHRLWHSLFHGDPTLVGRTITLEGESHTVVGIMPAGFEFAPFWQRNADLFTPLQLGARLSDRSGQSLRVFARLGPGVSQGQAQAEMDGIWARQAAAHPEDSRDLDVRVQPLHERVVGQVKRPLQVLLAAVIFVLLIACANLANLLLARGSTRRKEIAVRRALGAGRGRIVRQLLTESLLLGVVGGLLGLLLARWGVDLLVTLGPANLPRLESISLDAQVLAFAAALALGTGLLFGLAPALRLSRLAPGLDLTRASRGVTDGARRSRLRGGLVVAQLALAVVLLAGAGLMGRSFLRLLADDAGLQAQGLLSAVVRLPADPDRVPALGDGQPDPARAERARARYREIVAALSPLPGVQSVSVTNHLPIAGDVWGHDYQLPGDRPGAARRAIYRLAAPGYFATMGMTLVAGRELTDADGPGAPGVVVVNQTFASRTWPGQSALGKHIQVEDGGPNPRQVVGVVKDLRPGDFTAPPGEEMYLSFLQSRGPRYLTVVVRARGELAGLADQLRQRLWSLDRSLAPPAVVTMESVLDGTLAQPRFHLLVLNLFAGMALVLAALGIYGVMAYVVSRRTQEIGIRLALGAQGRDVRAMVLGQGLALVVGGLALGLAAALAATRAMHGMLFGVTSSDPLTFAVILGALFAVAFLACYLPARRATRVDPMVALRAD